MDEINLMMIKTCLSRMMAKMRPNSKFKLDQFVSMRESVEIYVI